MQNNSTCQLIPYNFHMQCLTLNDKSKCNNNINCHSYRNIFVITTKIFCNASKTPFVKVTKHIFVISWPNRFCEIYITHFVRFTKAGFLTPQKHLVLATIKRLVKITIHILLWIDQILLWNSQNDFVSKSLPNNFVTFTKYFVRFTNLFLQCRSNR